MTIGAISGSYMYPSINYVNNQASPVAEEEGGSLTVEY